MVPLLAWFALASREVSVLDAMAAGTRVLAAFDVPGQYKSLDVRRIVDKGTAFKDVELLAGNGRKYLVSVFAETGRCHNVSWEQGLVQSTHNDAPKDPFAPLPPDREAAIRQGLDRLGLLGDLVNPRAISGGFRQRLYWSAGPEGHPFFGGTNAFVAVGLDRDTGDFATFYQNEPPPEADRTPPRLSQDESVEAARAYLKDHPVRYYLAAGRKVEFGVGFDLPQHMPFAYPLAQLGWLLPRGQSKVRLAWAVPYWDRAMEEPAGRDAGGYVDGKSLNLLALLYIDAATGERVLSDTLPMERYP